MSLFPLGNGYPGRRRVARRRSHTVRSSAPGRLHGADEFELGSGERVGHASLRPHNLSRYIGTPPLSELDIVLYNSPKTVKSR
jgi:hypothetical protein